MSRKACVCSFIETGSRFPTQNNSSAMLHHCVWGERKGNFIFYLAEIGFWRKGQTMRLGFHWMRGFDWFSENAPCHVEGGTLQYFCKENVHFLTGACLESSLKCILLSTYHPPLEVKGGKKNALLDFSLPVLCLNWFLFVCFSLKLVAICFF